MKALRYILLILGFAAIIQTAFAQHGEFSDWNVPPPQIPGTVPKARLKDKSDIPHFTDVPPVNMPLTGPAQLNKMPPVLLVAPEVITPGQPAIQELSATSFGTPLPTAPDAPVMPAEVPHDAVFKMTADVSAPDAPPMPELPKSIPNEAPTGKPQGGTHLPVTLSIESPLQVEVSNDQFSFSEWAMPGIPGDTEVAFPLPDIAPPKALSKPKLPGKKTHKTSNSN